MGFHRLQQQMFIKVFTKHNMVDILPGFDFDRNPESPVFHHKVESPRDGEDILIADVNPKERDIISPFTEGVNLPELAKATNYCFNILLVLAQDRPMAKPNPNLVSKMPYVKLGRLGPVREFKIHTLKPVGAPTDCRFPDDPVGKENRQEMCIKVGHQVISAGPLKSIAVRLCERTYLALPTIGMRNSAKAMHLDSEGSPAGAKGV